MGNVGLSGAIHPGPPLRGDLDEESGAALEGEEPAMNRKQAMILSALAGALVLATNAFAYAP